MERLLIDNSTDIERCKRMHLVIIVCIPCVYVSVCDASASSVQHRLFPLCVFFEIVLDNPFGVLILYYPLSSAKLPIFIFLTFLLHTNLVLFFPFCFYKCSTVLSIFGVNGNGWRKPRNLGRPLCPFCICFVVIGLWDRSLTSSSQILRSNLD